MIRAAGANRGKIACEQITIDDSFALRMWRETFKRSNSIYPNSQRNYFKQSSGNCQTVLSRRPCKLCYEKVVSEEKSEKVRKTKKHLLIRIVNALCQEKARENVVPMPEARFSKIPQTFRAEKPLKLRSACFGKLVFSHVFKEQQAK